MEQLLETVNLQHTSVITPLMSCHLGTPVDAMNDKEMSESQQTAIEAIF